MSDLYGGNDDRSSFEPDSEPGPQAEEDMSFLLHNLLHDSPAAPPDGASWSRSAAMSRRGGSASMIDSSAGPSVRFADPGGFFAKDRAQKAFSLAAAVGDSDAVSSSMNRGGFSNANKGSDGSDTALNQAHPQSSKRSRSAEVHNLSEKMRRSRINEKLKALQNLIPNSNKTDKASMLDEAIEYLKQLQLQVQMLTMRNGLGLHPYYLSGSLPSVHLPMDFGEENVMPNASRAAETSSSNQDVAMQTMLGFSNPKISSQQPSAPSLTNNNTLAFSFGLESPMQNNNYGNIHHLTAAKDIFQEDALMQLPLDIRCSGNNSSSGVSS